MERGGDGGTLTVDVETANYTGGEFQAINALLEDEENLSLAMDPIVQVLVKVAGLMPQDSRRTKFQVRILPCH